jgi:hypothetical protein
VVRGPAAVLAAYTLALVYFLVAPGLPSLPQGDPATLVSDGVGLAALGGCVLALVGAREQTWALVTLGLGGALLTVALQAGGVSAGANVFEAAMATAAGMLFARLLAAPQALVTVPLLVAGIDAVSVFSGPGSSLIRERPAQVDFLVFPLPAWGGGTAGQLGLADLVFLAVFAAWAWHFGLRARITAAALVAALLVAFVLNLELGRAVPILPLLAIALLVPNLDRVLALFSERPAG